MTLGSGVTLGSGDVGTDSVGVAIGVGSAVSDGVGVIVLLGTGGGDADGTGEFPTVLVGEGVGVPVGVGAQARFCGTGTTRAIQSDAFSFVSIRLPPAPPGRRSMLLPVPGAAAALPSTNAFVASPQPTESITAPPITRMARAPPEAAMPPVYVASAEPANAPEAFATRRCCPGASGRDVVHADLRVAVVPAAAT